MTRVCTRLVSGLAVGLLMMMAVGVSLVEYTAYGEDARAEAHNAYTHVDHHGDPKATPEELLAARRTVLR